MSRAGETNLDTRGLRCPQPIIDLARAITPLAAGDELLVLADDLAFPLDLRAWCAGTGHELLALSSAGRVHEARIRKRVRS